MSSVIIQVGQCGNQVGQSFWNLAADLDYAKHGPVYVHPESDRLMFRSVNIDTEPKVVRSLYQEHNNQDIRYRETNLVTSVRGRGSNWALGYHGMIGAQEENILERSLEAIRKECERCDYLSGVIMLHSVAGGTGSGLGSRLIQALYDECSVRHRITCTVAPLFSGESPLQHYNSLLTLSHLQQYADSIMLFQNDELINRLLKRQNPETTGETKSVSFKRINNHIASCLAAVLFPTDTLSRTYSIGSEPYEMFRALCPMPSLKFVSDVNCTAQKQSWVKMASSILQSRQNRDEQGKEFSTLACLAVYRGDNTGSFSSDVNAVEKKLKSGYKCVSWNPFPVDFWTAKDTAPFKKHSSLTVAANTSALVPYVEHILDRSWSKFTAKAYLHWYLKYGSVETDFEEAFEILQRLVADYKDAVK